MDRKNFFPEVIQILKALQIPFDVLELDNNARIIAAARGGRILGPFSSPESSSIYWMHPDWDREIERGGWNIGGERLWIAPELQYCVRDRSRALKTYQLPDEMDPSSYRLLSREPNTLSLSANISLQAFDPGWGEQTISLLRTLSPAANPLRMLRRYEELMENLHYFGYIHKIELFLPQPSQILSEPWSLIQVRQGGIALLPMNCHAQIGWYYRPEKNIFTHYGSISVVTLEEELLFKFGIHASGWSGRSGYLHKNPDKTSWTLMIRSCAVDPSGTYTEAPFTALNERGYAYHIYNSSDKMLQFGEIECQAPAVGGDTKRTRSADDMLTWFFQGSLERLFPVASLLLLADTDQLAAVWPI